MFKSSDYRLSPFELESALIEHEAVDGGGGRARARSGALHHAQGLCRARAGLRRRPPSTAASIFAHVRERLSPYKRVRRIEFAELPKTPSGKIRRVELRGREAELAEKGERADGEFRIEDFSVE